MVNTPKCLAIAAAGLALLLTTTPAHTQTYDKLMFLKFSGPVQVPGVTLERGTYRFRLVDPNSSLRVLQVLSRDSSRLYGTFMTTPTVRRKATDDPVATFREGPAGEPPAIRALFYGGERTGYEFIYPVPSLPIDELSGVRPLD